MVLACFIFLTCFLTLAVSVTQTNYQCSIDDSCIAHAANIAQTLATSPTMSRAAIDKYLSLLITECTNQSVSPLKVSALVPGIN